MSKVIEAREHCKQAEKHLRKSLFKWKPEYDSAAHEYEQAGQCYRVARDPQKAKTCFMKASELYKKNHSYFYAGKAVETCIMATKAIATPKELFDLGMESCESYQQHGSGDAAANILDKVAKLIEQIEPEFAVILYQKAADVSSTESSQHQGSEFISKSSRILVKLQRFDEAVDSLRREIGFHQESGNMRAIGRLTVAIVLVQLARGDVVAAEKAYKEWGNNCEAPEMQTLEELLQAYDEEDREAAKKALSSPFIRSMDVEYSRLAGAIPLPEGLEPALKASVRPNAAPSYVSQKHVKQQDVAGAGLFADFDGGPNEMPEKKPEEEDELC